MVFRRQIRIILVSSGLIITGMALTTESQHCMWGAVAGTLLIAIWLAMQLKHVQTASSLEDDMGRAIQPSSEPTMPLGILLDQLPTPLVSIEAGQARALNRAARALFSTQDRIDPLCGLMLQQDQTRIVIAGRHWRIDRLETHNMSGSRVIISLIDIDSEERSGEARAAAEIIQVMGHEVLNGLAPIVSLAESGLEVWLRSEGDRGRLMPEILTTLARRAESLQRFTEAYRALARLPEPNFSMVSTDEFTRDLEMLFSGRWGESIAFRVEGMLKDSQLWADRDQLTQGVWALLQNAAEAALAGKAEAQVILRLSFNEKSNVIFVSDSGFGIPSHERARIFHPFHTTKAEGTGIGLSLSRSIARAHGGDLQLESSHPTTFAITIPLRGGSKI